MIESGIDVVNTNGVHLKMSVIGGISLRNTYTQLLHNNSITKTHVCVSKGILALCWLVTGLTSRLVVNTNDHQSFVCNGINEVLTANLYGVDGVHNAREQGGDESERANELSGR